MISINTIYYIAGWLEGEGAFTIYNKGKYKQFRIEYSSCDYDTIVKITNILDSTVKVFLRKQRYNESGDPHKPEYYAKITGNITIQWMMTLYSLMSKRRQEKIKSIISDWKNYIENNSGKCRKCKGDLIRTVIKGGWNKGKKQTYCRYCRGKKVA